MGELTYVLRKSWWRLIPFFICIGTYSALVQFRKSGEAWTAATKCAPIISLMLFILFFGITYFKTNPYPRRIFFGLGFSCAGDVLLDLNFFEYGLGMFLLAQICFIVAFGFRPFKWWIGVIMYIFAAIVSGVLLKHLDSISLYGLPIYGLVLGTMSWRALARMWLWDDGSILLTRVICGFCSLLFVTSDTIIAIDRFYTDIPYSGFCIMITYYLAQFGIALSVIPPNSYDTKPLLNETPSPVEISSPDSRSAKTSRLTD